MARILLSETGEFIDYGEPESTWSPARTEQVFDDLIIGTAAQYTSIAWNDWLASGARYRIHAVADQVTGTSPLCVQRMLDTAAPNALQLGAAFFGAKRLAPQTSRLIHNGNLPGGWAVTAIDFPGHSAAPQLTQPTTCIAYMENYDNGISGLGDGEIDQLKQHALDIEAAYGWESDDLFTVV